MNRHRRILAGLGPLGLMFGCSAPAPSAHRGSTTTSAPADAGPDATAATSEAATSTELDPSSTAAVTSPPAAVDATTTTVTVTVPTVPRTTTTWTVPTVPRTTTTWTVPTVPRTTTTWTVPERRDEDLSDAEWWEAQPGYVAGACGGSLPPCWVMRTESGGDPTAVNATGCGGRGCFGKWQFDPRTSRGLGYPLTMDQYPESVQDDAARALWAGGQGCSHWAAC